MAARRVVAQVVGELGSLGGGRAQLVQDRLLGGVQVGDPTVVHIGSIVRGILHRAIVTPP